MGSVDFSEGKQLEGWTVLWTPESYLQSISSFVDRSDFLLGWMHMSLWKVGPSPRPRECPGGQPWCGAKGVPSPLMDCADLDSEHLQQDQENWCSEASSPTCPEPFKSQNPITVRGGEAWAMTYEKLETLDFLTALVLWAQRLVWVD